MKLCFLGDGGNTHLQRIASSLASRGHAVHVVTHKPADIPGVTVERFSVPLPSVIHPFRWESRRVRYLRSFARRFDAVVLFFLSDWGFDPEILESGRFIAFPQGSDIVPPPGEMPPELELVSKRREWLRSVTLVGATCPRFRSIVATFAGLEADQVAPLPIGVDTDLFRRPTDVPKYSRPPVVGYLKGFREVYGPTVFVDAMPSILDRFPDAIFEMVGDGPQLGPCRERATELGVAKSVRWLPRAPHQDVPKLLSRWDLSVMPSHFESFGVAAVESAAMGVPVIASNIGGLPDSVSDGKSGLLVEPNAPSELAEAALTLLADSDRRRRMGQDGAAWANRHFNWSAAMDQWEETLTRAIENATLLA